MCGIFALFGNDNTENLDNKRNYYLNLSKKIRHRGPDWNGIFIDNDNKALICHERLSIVGVENGSQPIEVDNIILSVNGEIYNYKELYQYVLHGKYTPKTKSDCEVLIYLYKEYGSHFVKMLDGIFSFVLYDKDSKKVVVSRDPIGIIPLYWGSTEKNEVFFASEMKCLAEDCHKIETFPPGYLCEFSIDDLENPEFCIDNDDQPIFVEKNLIKYYDPNYRLNTYFQADIQQDQHSLCKQINDTLTQAVEKRLMADVPFGVLLSGGLDSSLIASITKRLMKDRKSMWGSDLHSFSIGLLGSPDLKAAKKVADFLGTIHHEFIFTVQEGIDAIRDLVYHLETFDVTTIRASTPMFLLSRRIKSMGIKMVLSGEGADEMFGGYLYFHEAPNDMEFHNECINRVAGLHHFDCLRANKSTMAWGLEARVPFLDQRLLELVMNMDPKVKLNKKDKKEKYILRKAFDDHKTPYLPHEILWRQKEQFSDGVGYSWIDGLLEFTKEMISDEKLTQYNQENKTEITKEALYYLEIFEELFPGRKDIVPRWIPRKDWGCSQDPSGRAQNVHVNHDLNL